MRTPQARTQTTPRPSSAHAAWDQDVPPLEGTTAAATRASPAQAREPREATGPGVLATEGEKKLIVNRCRNNDIDLAGLLQAAGLEGLPADLDGLTKDGFIALKDQLPAAS